MTKIKICGITNAKEAAFLNQHRIDYAGFVLYEKSRRYISIAKAMEISKKLNDDIIKVAVTVSPETEEIRRIQEAGFDMIQIHGSFEERGLQEMDFPVWIAQNLSAAAEWKPCSVKDTGENNIKGIVFDAAEYGSGKTFDWEQSGHIREERAFLREMGKQFVLAGGLNSQNVRRGIHIFAPDVVDVSSGVEIVGDGGKTEKSPEKIEEFVRAVRE